MRVYEFEVQESYEWVAPVTSADFEVFRSFDGSARRTSWAPIRVRLVKEDQQGRQLASADMPWLGKHAPVLKKKASSALGPVVATNGELLPLACDEVELAVYNVTTVVDALDLERSALVKFPSSGRVMKVESHVFRPDRVKNVRAFKVPELLRGPVFVTDDVVSAAQGAPLIGVGFRLVWEDSAAAA